MILTQYFARDVIVLVKKRISSTFSTTAQDSRAAAIGQRCVHADGARAARLLAADVRFRLRRSVCGGEAAVGVKQLSRDPPSFVGDEERDQRADVRRPPEAPERVAPF